MSEPIAVISSMATRHILSELAEVFTAKTGRGAVVESVGGLDAARRIRSGEAFDVAVLATDAISSLACGGFVIADTIYPFALSPTAVAVRSGSLRSAICDEASIRDLVVRSRGIGLSTGPSGASVRALLQSWGLGETVGDRIIQVPPGVPVAHVIANGDADIGFQQLSELMGEPGIDIVGAVPSALLPMTEFSVGLCACATNAAGAHALIEFLQSNEAALVKRRFGMDVPLKHPQREN